MAKKIFPPSRLIFATLSPDLEHSSLHTRGVVRSAMVEIQRTWWQRGATRVRLDGAVLTVYAKPYLRDVYKRGTVVI